MGFYTATAMEDEKYRRENKFRSKALQGLTQDTFYIHRQFFRSSLSHVEQAVRIKCAIIA